MSDDNHNRDQASAANDDGRVQLTRRPLPDRAHRIADDLAGIAHELREGNAGTSDQRLRLAAAIVSMHMLGDDLRAQLAAANALSVADHLATEAAEEENDRLRAELAAANERAEKAEARVTHLDKARDAAVREWKREHDAADALQTENAKLRAQLDALGEEWGYRFGQGGGEDGFDSEATARLIAAPGDTIVRRLATDWEVVGEPVAPAPDAAADGHSGPVRGQGGAPAPAAHTEAGDGPFFEPGHTYLSENGAFRFTCERVVDGIALGTEERLDGRPQFDRNRVWKSVMPDGCWTDATGEDR